MTNRSHSWFVVAACLLLPAVYTLSEAPIVRLAGVTPHGGWWRLYSPVDWAIDNTPLREPLLSWARLWSVEVEFVGAEWYRQPVEMVEDW